MINPSEKQDALVAMLRGFDNAMFTTLGKGGELHTRPLRIAAVEDSGEIYFATSSDSAKIAELAVTSSVLLTLQGSSQFLSIRGNAAVTQDRVTIDRLWQESWRLWFPDGKSDPKLCLIRVVPTRGEYWDQSGLKGWAFAFEAASALAAGRTPRSGSDQHSEVEFPGANTGPQQRV